SYRPFDGVGRLPGSQLSAKRHQASVNGGARPGTGGKARASTTSERRERSAPAKRRARARVGESEGRSRSGSKRQQAAVNAGPRPATGGKAGARTPSARPTRSASEKRCRRADGVDREGRTQLGAKRQQASVNGGARPGTGGKARASTTSERRERSAPA